MFVKLKSQDAKFKNLELAVGKDRTELLDKMEEVMAKMVGIKRDCEQRILQQAQTISETTQKFRKLE
jgi:hypothetical protein